MPIFVTTLSLLFLPCKPSSSRYNYWICQCYPSDQNPICWLLPDSSCDFTSLLKNILYGLCTICGHRSVVLRKSSELSLISLVEASNFIATVFHAKIKTPGCLVLRCKLMCRVAKTYSFRSEVGACHLYSEPPYPTPRKRNGPFGAKIR